MKPIKKLFAAIIYLLLYFALPTVLALVILPIVLGLVGVALFIFGVLSVIVSSLFYVNGRLQTEYR